MAWQDLALFLLDITIKKRPLKGQTNLTSLRLLNRRSSRVGACNVVLNDVFLIGRQFIFAVVPFEKYWESLGEC